MRWIDFTFAALLLGLLVKTNLIEDRIKKLGYDTERKAEHRTRKCGGKRDSSLDDGAKNPSRP